MRAMEEQGENFDAKAFESADNKRQVLEELIDEQVMRLASTREGIVISDGEVRNAIQAVPDFQVDGKFDADRIAAHDWLRLRGVMAVAPLGADPAVCFADLRDIADGIRSTHPGASWISAGMSADLEAAVAAGATHLRVGTAILGSRPPLL